MVKNYKEQFIIKYPNNQRLAQYAHSQNGCKFLDTCNNIIMKKILIVDDEEKLAECLKEEFEFLGHSVIVVNESSDAPAQIFSEIFDIILLDIKMPRVNGVELFEQIKPHTDAKIVFLSAISDMMSHDPVLKKADMILEKPFSVEDIRKIVDLAK